MKPYLLPYRTFERLLLCALLLLSGWLAAARPASAQSPTPPPEFSPALGFHVAQGDALHMQAVKAAGGQFAVVVFTWANIEPEPNYVYWEQPDAALRAAEFYGLEVIARLDQPPAWALDEASPTPWNLEAYANFARRVARRYGGVLLAHDVCTQRPTAAVVVAQIAVGQPPHPVSLEADPAAADPLVGWPGLADRPAQVRPACLGPTQAGDAVAHRWLPPQP